MKNTAEHEHGSTVESPVYTVSDLVEMSVSELGELYAESSVPDSLAELDGKPPGRMLAAEGRALSALGPLAGSRLFPWLGKSFRALDAATGEGRNRLRGLGERFRFETRFEDSVLDGAPCVVLDYDHEGNPRLIRRIRDELRQVSPGLFFGPALLRRRDSYKLLLYFSVDHSAP